MSSTLETKGIEAKAARPAGPALDDTEKSSIGRGWWQNQGDVRKDRRSDHGQGDMRGRLGAPQRLSPPDQADRGQSLASRRGISSRGLIVWSKPRRLVRHRNQRLGNDFEAKELFKLLGEFEAAVKLPTNGAGSKPA